MKKDINDYLHLYLGCDVMIEKSSYWCVHEFDYHKGEKRLLLPSVLTWVRNSEMIVKPILRPLSDMTEEEFKEMYTEMPGRITVRYPKRGMFESTPYQVVFMLSKGFDLFGLIEAGLAIDKTTLKEKV